MLIVKPNRWSCLPTAFCMIEGFDPETFINELDQDGSEIINPDLPEPMCRRGFDPQEILDALYEKKIFYQEIIYEPQVQYANGKIRCYVKDLKQRMNKYIRENVGVIIGAYSSGKGHAYAVKRGYIFDPDTGMQCILPEDFKIMSFYMRVYG